MEIFWPTRRFSSAACYLPTTILWRARLAVSTQEDNSLPQQQPHGSAGALQLDESSRWLRESRELHWLRTTSRRRSSICLTDCLKYLKDSSKLGHSSWRKHQSNLTIGWYWSPIRAKKQRKKSNYPYAMWLLLLVNSTDDAVKFKVDDPGPRWSWWQSCHLSPYIY